MVCACLKLDTSIASSIHRSRAERHRSQSCVGFRVGSACASIAGACPPSECSHLPRMHFAPPPAKPVPPCASAQATMESMSSYSPSGSSIVGSIIVLFLSCDCSHSRMHTMATSGKSPAYTTTRDTKHYRILPQSRENAVICGFFQHLGLTWRQRHDIIQVWLNWNHLSVQAVGHSQ